MLVKPGDRMSRWLSRVAYIVVSGLFPGRRVVSRENSVECLRGAIGELVDMFNEVSGGEIPGHKEGNFEFVANLFFETQAEYLRAAHTLLKSKNFIPGKIIGRTMFEGMALLLWIAKDREDRAMKWRAWSTITDWRLLQQRDKIGASTDSDTRERVLDRVEEFGPLFLSKKPKGDDPYRKDWTPSVRGMVESTPLEDLYYAVYHLESQWVHWTAAGLGQALSVEGDTVRYAYDRPSHEIEAMNIVFHSAWHVIYNFCGWFGAGLENKLDELAERYTASGEKLIKAR